MESRIKIIIAFTIVLCTYLATLVMLPKDIFWSPDEGARFIIAQILNPNSDKPNHLGYPGAKMDPVYKFHPSIYQKGMYPTPKADGTIKYAWSIWFPMITGWLYTKRGFSGLYLIPLVSGLLIVIMTWHLSNFLNNPYPFWTVILVGLGTPIYFYSVVYWDHTLASLLGILALFGLVRYRRPVIQWLWLVLLPLIIAVILRVEMLSFTLSLALTFGIANSLKVSTSQLPREKIHIGKTQINLNHTFSQNFRIFRTPLLVAMAIGFFLVFFKFLLPNLPERHYLDIRQFFGALTNSTNPWKVGSSLILRMSKHLPHLLINYSAAEGLHYPEYVNLVGCIALILCLVGAFIRSTFLKYALPIPGFVILVSLGLYTIFSSQPYRSLHGLFISAPFGAVFVYPLVEGWRKRNYSDVMVSLCASMYFVIGSGVILGIRSSRVETRWPGLEWGSRYLLTIYPIFVLLSLKFLNNMRKAHPLGLIKYLITGLIGLMMLSGILLQVRGIWMLKQSKQRISSWQGYLQNQLPDAVVSDIWWIPASLAKYFTEHEMYAIRDSQDMSNWLSLAIEYGIDRFTYVSFLPKNLENYSLANVKILRKNSKDIHGIIFVNYTIER